MIFCVNHTVAADDLAKWDARASEALVLHHGVKLIKVQNIFKHFLPYYVQVIYNSKYLYKK